MSKYRFTLNNQVLEDEPDGWNEAKITNKRDPLINGLFTLSTTNLVFHGDGYRILNNIINELGYLQLIPILIEERICQENFEEFISGTVFLSDISEHNLTTKRITVPVTDDVFGKSINPNKNIKAFINVPRSKNDKLRGKTEFQSPVLVEGTEELIDFFRPSNGIYLGTLADRRAYKVADVLRFLTEYMTDIDVGFRSDYLLDPNNFEGGIPYCCTGAELRNASGAKAPNLSFGELYQAMQRLTNLSISIEEETSGRPIVRCEHASSFFSGIVSEEIRDIKDLKVSVNTERIYSHLFIGNEPFINQFMGFPSYDNELRYFTFRDEDYLFKGEANTDIPLDLRTSTISETKFITDSNTLEAILIQNSPANDDDIFIFIADPDVNQSGFAGGSAIKYSLSGGNPHFYNKPFRNKEILEKWDGFLPNTVAKYIDSGNATFLAQTNGANLGNRKRITQSGQTAQEVIDFVGFADDFTSPNNDPGSNYSIVTHRYTIPINGQYSFETLLNMVLRPLSGPVALASFKYVASIIHANVVNTPIESVTQEVVISNDVNVNPFALFDIPVSATFQDCTVGDKIFVRLIIIPVSPVWKAEHLVLEPSTFACTGTEQDGGAYQAQDPKKYRVIEYKFSKPLALETFKNLSNLADQTLIINECSDPNKDKKTFIQEVTYNNTNSETEFFLTN